MQAANDILDETATAADRKEAQTTAGGLRRIDPIRASVWGAIAVAAGLSWFTIAKGIAAAF